MSAPRSQILPLLARVAGVVCGLAAVVLGIYAVIAAYAGATFEGDSLPGPMVLYMVAFGVGVGAFLCAGLAHVLWRKGKPQA